MVMLGWVSLGALGSRICCECRGKGQHTSPENGPAKGASQHGAGDRRSHPHNGVCEPASRKEQTPTIVCGRRSQSTPSSQFPRRSLSTPTRPATCKWEVSRPTLLLSQRSSTSHPLCLMLLLRQLTRTLRLRPQRTLHLHLPVS